jgi:hypothetical protein
MQVPSYLSFMDETSAAMVLIIAAAAVVVVVAACNKASGLRAPGIRHGNTVRPGRVVWMLW